MDNLKIEMKITKSDSHHLENYRKIHPRKYETIEEMTFDMMNRLIRAIVEEDREKCLTV